MNLELKEQRYFNTLNDFLKLYKLENRYRQELGNKKHNDLEVLEFFTKDFNGHWLVDFDKTFNKLRIRRFEVTIILYEIIDNYSNKTLFQGLFQSFKEETSNRINTLLKYYPNEENLKDFGYNTLLEYTVEEILKDTDLMKRFWIEDDCKVIIITLKE